jgi:hypothetical protein
MEQVVTPADVVDQVVTMTATYLTYLLPIIAVMSAVTFVASFLFASTIRFADRLFKR